MSPRPDALGELISATKDATVRELQQCLEGIAEQKEARAKADLERDEQQARGEKILRDWAKNRGSPLLKGRLDGGYQWLDLAGDTALGIVF